MQTNREAGTRRTAELRRQARRLREIGMIETDAALDLGEVAAGIDRKADALENPFVSETGNRSINPHRSLVTGTGSRNSLRFRR